MEPLTKSANRENFYSSLQGKIPPNPKYLISNSMTSQDYTKIFSIREATQQFFFEAYEVFKVIGNNSSALIGIMIIFGVSKFLINWIINGIAIYNLFGFRCYMTIIKENIVNVKIFLKQ